MRAWPGALAECRGAFVPYQVQRSVPPLSCSSPRRRRGGCTRGSLGGQGGLWGAGAAPSASSPPESGSFGWRRGPSHPTLPHRPLLWRGGGRRWWGWWCHLWRSFRPFRGRRRVAASWRGLLGGCQEAEEAGQRWGVLRELGVRSAGSFLIVRSPVGGLVCCLCPRYSCGGRCYYVYIIGFPFGWLSRQWLVCPC